MNVDGDLWLRAFGTPYKAGPGTSAIINMESVARHRKIRWVLTEGDDEYWKPPCQISDLRWTRAPARRGGWGPRWDMRAAYLAAAAGADLPYLKLRPTGLDPQRCGYLRLLANPADWATVPMLPPLDRQHTLWVTHELADVLAVTGIGHEVIDSYTTENSGRILRSWAEHWRTRTAAHPSLAPAAKLGYAQAIGMMGSRTESVYRPDWRHILIDYVRASMIRRILRVHTHTGMWPAKVDVDSVWYDRPKVSPELYLGVGRRIGNMRYEGLDPWT